MIVTLYDRKGSGLYVTIDSFVAQNDIIVKFVEMNDRKVSAT